MPDGIPLHEAPQATLDPAPDVTAQPQQQALFGDDPSLVSTGPVEPQGALVPEAVDISIHDPYSGLFGVPLADPTGGGTPAESAAAPAPTSDDAGTSPPAPAPEASAPEPGDRVARLEAQLEALVGALSGAAASPPVPTGTDESLSRARDAQGRFAPTPEPEALPELPVRPEGYSRFDAQHDPDSPSAQYEAQVAEYDDAMRGLQRRQAEAALAEQQNRQQYARHQALREQLAAQAQEKYGFEPDQAGAFLDTVADRKTLDDMDSWAALYMVRNGDLAGAARILGQQAPAPQAPTPTQQSPVPPTALQGIPQGVPQGVPQGTLFNGIQVQDRQTSQRFPATVAGQSAGHAAPIEPFEAQVARAINQSQNVMAAI